MLRPSLVAEGCLFALSKIENQYSHLPVCPAGQPPSASGFSSAAGEWLIYCLKKNRLTLYSLLSALIISFMAFYFQLQILSYLLVETYHEILHTSNHSESEIKFEVLTDAPLGVILYHDVVLNKQISISQSLKSF